MSAHTPTPWQIFKAPKSHIYVGVGERTGEGILDAGFGLWRSGPEREANAAFIVEAVNSHDAFVELAKGVVGAFKDKTISGTDAKWLVDRARAALKALGRTK